jgi:hypothetical protein
VKAYLQTRSSPNMWDIKHEGQMIKAMKYVYVFEIQGKRQMVVLELDISLSFPVGLNAVISRRNL